MRGFSRTYICLFPLSVYFGKNCPGSCVKGFKPVDQVHIANEGSSVVFLILQDFEGRFIEC